MSHDSRVDLEKYLPSPEALREAADETAARERLQKALASVEDDDLVTTPGGPGAGLTRKAALGPVVAPPVTKRVEVEKSTPPSWLRSPVRAGILAIAVVFFPVILVFVLFVKPERSPVEGMAKTAATASAQALSVGEAGVGVGLPEGGAAVVPVVPPEASSAAVPVAPPAASGEAAPMKPKIKSKDPYDAAPLPSPPKTGSPSMPTAPTDVPSAAPSAPPPTGSSWF